MERSFGSFSPSQFKVKYKEAALQTGPSGISGYLGTLHKGAVVEIIEDNHPYYYLVRLDSGLEGYVYKAAGEVVGSLSGLRLRRPTPAPEVKPASVDGLAPKPVPAPATPVPPAASTNGNGSYDSAVTTNRSAVRQAGSSTTSRLRPAQTSGSRPSPVARSSRGLDGAASRNGTGAAARPGRVSRSVVVTTSEIAVYDRPGIVGQQVGRLRRGETATLVNQDSFFYEVALPNGTVGYIPRYTAELS